MHFFSTGATFAAVLLLAVCCTESLNPVPSRSAKWDDYMNNHLQRQRRSTDEWQNGPRGSVCTLSNLTTYDALGRRDSGILSAVQDQGRCGSCWAFAATHVYTDYKSIAAGMTVEGLSQDYVTKCNENTVNGNGCCGVSPDNAESPFTFFEEVGTVSETCRPYTLDAYIPAGISGYQKLEFKRANPLICQNSCENSTIPFAPNILSTLRIIPLSLADDEAVISVLQTSPVYALMHVSNAFRNYVCGVFCEQKRGSNNHAVEIVDYSMESYSGTPYWVVKNSYGLNCGEDGYFRIARNLIDPFIAIDPSGVPPSQFLSSPGGGAISGSACAAQEASTEEEQVLIQSAAEFGIEVINSRSGIRCAEDESTVAILSFDSVITGTIQSVEGSMVEVTVQVDVDGCSEDTASVTFGIFIDMDGAFSLIEYYDYTVDEAGSDSPAITVGYVTMTLLCVLSALM